MSYNDELELWWDMLCQNLDDTNKPHSGYTKRLMAIGMPDVVWTYLDELSKSPLNISVDELFSRVVIAYLISSLENKDNIVDIELAIEMLRDMIKDGKLKSKPITIK